VGKYKEITDKWVEEQLTATHLTKTAAHAMQLKDPKVASPHQMFPTVSSPYKVNSPLFTSTNLPNYLRIIMFGCLGQNSYKHFMHIAADVSPYKMQTYEKCQYLKLSNLFDNEFLVVHINKTVIAMADTYAEFCFNLTQHKDTPLPKAVPDDKHFFRSIALFRLTADLLKKAVTAGINPKLNVDPRSIGFDPEDVDIYGYYALFVTKLPFYMQQIWGPETAELYELLQPEEKEQEDAAREARMEANVAASDTTGEYEEEANKGEDTEDSENEQEYKVDISKYSMIFKVHTKLTVKTTKIGQGAAKLSDKVFNALPWYGLERHLQNQSIEPKIDNLWNALFAEGTSTPLQTLMIKVNQNKATTPVTKKMTKKHFFDELSLESGALDAAGTDALDISDRLEGHVEELRDMKDDKGINIPDNVIEKVASMVDQVKDLHQKIHEANNNICKLKYQFMGKTKQT
jgi:hypothetical protein